MKTVRGERWNVKNVENGLSEELRIALLKTPKDSGIIIIQNVFRRNRLNEERNMVLKLIRVTCVYCGGTGREPDVRPGTTRKCFKCAGSGWVNEWTGWPHPDVHK